MIKIDSVAIKNFRGVKDLEINLRQNSFAIAGPNGTGKSGIVDAIEFALTGNITRLTGRGAGELSVKSHAPHVDHRNDPSQSSVKISAYSLGLHKAFTLERFVSKAKRPQFLPNDPDIEALVKRLEQHPELALSRREIVKYIIAEPGARSEEVQSLLKLEDIGRLGKSFATVANRFKRDWELADNSLNSNQALLLSGLGIETAKSVLVIAAVNKRREVLAAEPLTSLEKGSNLKIGIDIGSEQALRSPISKSVALSDIETLRRIFRSLQSPDSLQTIGSIISSLERLEADPSLLRDLQHNSLLQKGLELLDSSECPLCGVHWEAEVLRQQIQSRLAKARLASDLQTRLDRDSQPLRELLRSLSSLVDLALGYAQQLLPEASFVALPVWRDSLLTIERSLAEADAQGIREWLNIERSTLPPAASTELDSLTQALTSLPERTEKDAAWEFLVIAQERFENYSASKAAAFNARSSFDVAVKITSAYAQISDRVLSDLYEDVQKDFGRYYGLIHQEDESSFFAKLTPSIGKLSFAVDFYGRGTFPPGAYHSEGHQDSMGLCLYLALMKKTMSSEFSLAILDDVLMSVDSGHRKAVVRLLKGEFPGTQFILTTHDQVWLNHMVNEGLVPRGSSLQIRRWTVDDGPLIEGPKDVWIEIEASLVNNDTLGAAALLRNHLERIASSLAERLRAQAEYRRDGGHDFGDLIGPVVGRWRDLLRMAKASANAWGKKSEIEVLAEMERRFAAFYNRAGIDSWIINKAVHYNEWANLQRQDFVQLVASYRDFLDCFRCPSCRTLLYVTPKKGTPEALRCDCNIFNLVLTSRKQAASQAPSPSKAPEVPSDQRRLF